MLLKKIKSVFEFPLLEGVAWLSGLTYLAFIDPYECSHFTLCIFKLLGFESCPGCGIGNAIALMYHGEFLESFNLHPLGIPAFFIILFRIYVSIKNTIKYRQLIKEKKNGKYVTVST